METYEFLLCPVNQVPPFDLKQRYVEEINGVRMNSYIDWMQSCWTISVLGLPAISVPAGFTPRGSRWASRSWGATRTTWGCCNWPTPTSRPPASGSAGRRCAQTAVVEPSKAGCF